MGAFDEPDPADLSNRGLLDPFLPQQNRQVVIQKPAPGTTLDSVPAPYKPLGDGELSERERADLATCEAGVENLQTAFWVAGKSLETLKTAELHRETHSNFADYVWARFELSESQTYRLMDAWRLGERIAKLGLRPRESQIRELVQVAKTEGQGLETAVAIYESVDEHFGKVTAKILNEVVQQLPNGPLASSAVDSLVRELRSQAEERESVRVITSVASGDQSSGADGGSPIGELTDQPGSGDGVGQDDPSASEHRDRVERPSARPGDGSGAAESDSGATDESTAALSRVLEHLIQADTELADIRSVITGTVAPSAVEQLAEIEGRATLIAKAVRDLLWGISSRDVALKAEQQRLVYRTQLMHEFGRWG